MQATLDTSFLVALIDSRDQWHQSALAVRDALIGANAETFYFDCVINETVSVLARRLAEQRRADDFPDLLDKLGQAWAEGNITWVSPDIPRLFGPIIALVREHHGALNFHDALIALGCREREIAYLVSFDRDFDDLGWLQRISRAADVPAS